MRIAIQLYSLNKQIEKLGFDNVLGKVKAAGFDGVEFAGYHELGVSGAANAIKKHGLIPMGAHIGLHDMQGQEFLRTAKELGLLSAAVPSIALDSLKNDFGNITSLLKIALDNCKSLGIPLYYHNHAFELEDGQDYLIKITDSVPGILLETDIFWVKAAGLSPYDYFKTHSGRIGVLHIKELNKLGIEHYNPIVGEGISDSARLLSHAKNAGHEWAVLEAENVQGDIFEYIAASKQAMCKFAG